MNNNDNKKSSKSWTQRLFKQSGATHATYRKLYFAHRYHDDHKTREQDSICTLFSGAGYEQADLPYEPSSLQRFFDGKELASSDNLEFAEAVQSCVSGPLIVEYNDSHQPNEVLNTQFVVLNAYSETLDTKTFRFGRLNAPIFDYLPGQYITLFRCHRWADVQTFL